jgi:hypothetical protein
MRRFAYDVIGLLLLGGSVFFYFQSVKFFGDRDYVAGILEIFVGMALTRAGLEVMKLGLAAATTEIDVEGP